VGKGDEAFMSEKCGWISFNYRKQLELARLSHCPLLAVQAELFRLHFRAWDKKAPVVLGNQMLHELGFDHHAKNRALRILEAAGWVRVEWRDKEAPRVVLLTGFRFGC